MPGNAFDPITRHGRRFASPVRPQPELVQQGKATVADIPDAADDSMSGGFVYLPRMDGKISACGIICADNSSDVARIDSSQCGESVIACAWPALCLCAPESIPATPETPMRTLYDFMRAGHLDTAVGGIDHIELVEMGNGDLQLRIR